MSKSNFLLCKVPLPYPRYCYLLVGTNVNNHTTGTDQTTGAGTTVHMVIAHAYSRQKKRS